MLDNISFIKPEIFLSITAMLLLVIGVFNKNKQSISRILFNLGIVALAITIGILYSLSGKAAAFDETAKNFNILLFNRGFVFDNFAYFIKIIICLISIAVFVIARNSKYYAGASENVFEFPVLMILSIVGMLILASANDLMTFYLGLELQSLAMYVLVAINRDSEASTESGVKYFVLGALASGVILFGSSLVYGFSGTTNLSDITAFMNTNQTLGSIPAGIIFGFVLIMAGIFFKLSAVPLHMWAPDVYEGATKPVITMISTAPKVAALAFFIRFVTSFHPDIFISFSKIIVIVSAASMILGSFAALRQDNIKRLLAYSSISNMGYMLIAVAIGTQASIQSALIYIMVYMSAALGIFTIISIMQKNGQDLDKIPDMAGLNKTNPVYALALAIFTFSIAGIPPMAGFMGKFFVFKEAVSGGFITLAVIGVVSSVIACFYYLRVVKVIYFDDVTGAPGVITVEKRLSIKILVGILTAFTMLMIFFMTEIIEIAKQATLSLF